MSIWFVPRDAAARSMGADAVAMIAEACNVSRADTHGVFTFYADLRDTPPLRCRYASAPPRPAKRLVGDS